MGRTSIVHVKNSIRWYLGKSVQIEDTWVCIGIVPNYQKLKTMEKRSVDQKLRLRNFDARHVKIESGTVVKSRKGPIGVEGGKGTCYQWKEKGQCSQGDRCSFRHGTQDRAQKPAHTAATPSEPTASQGRSVSRVRSIRGKSNHGSILRQPCRYHLRGTCTRSPCEHWHAPECQNHKTETVCKEGGQVSVSALQGWWTTKQKVEKEQLFAKREEKAMTRMLWLLWEVYHNWVATRKTRKHRFLKVANSLEEILMQKVLEPIQRVRFRKSTLRQASIREKKGPSLGKINVKAPRRRSHFAMKFEDRSHEETEWQQWCARSKAWNLAKNIYKLKEKDKAAFYFRAEERVLPAASTKEPEERVFVVDSGASVHMVSRRDLNSAELEIMRTSKSPTTVITANGEVQTREEATVYVKQLDLFVKVMLLEETPAVISLGKLCKDHGCTYRWISGQKTHLIRNGKRIDCNFSNYVPFVVPGLSTISSSTTPTPTSPSSSSQDSAFDVNRYTKTPSIRKKWKYEWRLRRDPLHESTETEKQK